MKENLANVDRVIGELLLFLQGRVAPKDLVVVLASDHGVLPLPEEELGRQMGARRIDKNELEEAIKAAVKKAVPSNPSPVMEIALPDVYLSFDDAALVKRAAEAVSRVPDIAHVYFPPFDDTDSYTPVYRRSYYPGRSGNLLVRLDEGVLPLSRVEGTTHGSPYEYDTHVPLIFWGGSFQRATFDSPVDVRDIAPTLAQVLGVPFQVADSAGRPLSEALKK
jgi:arylsulfatase A-like enzyme